MNLCKLSLPINALREMREGVNLSKPLTGFHSLTGYILVEIQSSGSLKLDWSFELKRNGLKFE